MALQAQIELQIYNLETSYLTETAAHSGGNIIQGFDGYLKNQTVGRRKYEVNENDRLFSRSSVTYQKVRRPCVRLVHTVIRNQPVSTIFKVA
jgi:hypothetical protein